MEAKKTVLLWQIMSTLKIIYILELTQYPQKFILPTTTSVDKRLRISPSNQSQYHL